METVRKLLTLWADPNRSNANTLLLAEGHMQELLDKEAALASMKFALQELIDACAGDGRPDCPILEDLADVRRHRVRTEEPTLEVSAN